jgi:oligopeptide/dipeptide ABC transporter ATP-binding protein
VREIDLKIAPGSTMGIVGESGCGKSTLGRMAAGLLEPSRGEVRILGRSLFDRKAHRDYAAFRRALAGMIQMVFQDPYFSLNPRMRIGQSVAEPLICARAGARDRERLWAESGLPGAVPRTEAVSGRGAIEERVARMLEQVGLEAAAAQRYPHEFSGGQRQRVAIARALITSPAFVICDEPTSSLDASVQSQVLNLLRDLQEDLRLTCMFISHDLAVVRHMSDQAAVMHQGLLVESGDAQAIFDSPCHPYTRELLESVSGADRSAVEAMPTPVPAGGPENGTRTVPPALREGCSFATHCPHAAAVCRQATPGLTAVDAPAARKGDGGANGRGGRRESAREIPDGKEGAQARPRLVRCFLYAGAQGCA